MIFYIFLLLLINLLDFKLSDNIEDILFYLLNIKNPLFYHNSLIYL